MDNVKLYYVKKDYLVSYERHLNRCKKILEVDIFNMLMENKPNAIELAEKYENVVNGLYELGEKLYYEGYSCKTDWNSLERLKKIHQYVEARSPICS